MNQSVLSYLSHTQLFLVLYLMVNMADAQEMIPSPPCHL